MKSEPLVDILLATWNGEHYLAAQLESVLAQTYENWQLFIRDDGSTDGTEEILQQYQTRYPGRLNIIRDDKANLGASGNFSLLMEHSDADYLMFCDQDDVWEPEKIETLMEAMAGLERDCGQDMPLLVHCDLKVVDDSLKEIAPSFWRYQKLNPEKDQFLNRLLVQNVVTGCALVMNRRTKDFALPVPIDARMHDWWIALVAAAFGRIGYVDRPLVQYRQHGGNKLGAKAWNLIVLLHLLFTGTLFQVALEKRKILADTQKQAGAFVDSYGAQLDDDCLDLVRAYAALPQLGPLARRIALFRHGFMLDGFIKKLGLIILI